MNELQIKLISNKKQGEQDKPYSISREYWKTFPGFHYRPTGLGRAMLYELLSLAALLFWIILLVFAAAILSKKLKAL
jgi:ABC-2 type transport system permease protein